MKAIIFVNGDYDYEENFVEELVDKEDYIFCADGGANYAYKYGLNAKCIIGDLDSIEQSVLEYYKNMNCIIEKYPREKDFTDFELILKKIDKMQKDEKIQFEKIYVLGGLGGRIDMTLNNLNLLETYKNLIFLTKDEEIFYKEESFELENKENYEFSIILLDSKIEKLLLKGFKYELDRVAITRKESRLVSNLITYKKAKVCFLRGKIIVILRKRNKNDKN